MTASTTNKLQKKLKPVSIKLPKKSNHTSQSVMVEATRPEMERTKRYSQFIKEALTVDTKIDAGAAVYNSVDVHAWLERLAIGDKTERPKPFRNCVK